VSYYETLWNLLSSYQWSGLYLHVKDAQMNEEPEEPTTQL